MKKDDKNLCQDKKYVKVPWKEFIFQIVFLIFILAVVAIRFPFGVVGIPFESFATTWLGFGILAISTVIYIVLKNREV